MYSDLNKKIILSIWQFSLSLQVVILSDSLFPHVIREFNRDPCDRVIVNFNDQIMASRNSGAYSKYNFLLLNQNIFWI